MKKMHIRIRVDGTAEMRVEGAVGNECEAFTRAFELAIGETTSREPTEDYYRDQVDVTAESRETV